jgi:hypothetical protein
MMTGALPMISIDAGKTRSALRTDPSAIRSGPWHYRIVVVSQPLGF